MRNRLAKAIIIAAFFAFSGQACAFLTAAEAQTPSDPTQTVWSDIPQVVVRAHIAGPVIWKVTKGDATVWILGVMDLKPEPLNWNANHFQRVLKGANILILINEAAWDPTNSTLPKNVHLKDVLSPKAYARFETRVQREGYALSTYDRYTPVWAGARLMGDVIDDHDISSHVLPNNIPDMARAAGVPVQALSQDNGQALVTLFDRLDKAGSEACLTYYLDSIDYLLDTLPKVTRAWARGDLNTVIRYHQQMAYTSCILSDATTAHLYPSYAIETVVTAIDKAMTVPGKSVVVWPLSDLLRKGGVMDQLRDEGATINAPAR